MSNDELEAVIQKYKAALNEEERELWESHVKRTLLRDMFYEFSCVMCGTALHQVERPRHEYDSQETWHMLTCPACREISMICFAGVERRITVISKQQVNALMQSLAMKKTLVCPDHGNEVEILTIRPYKGSPVKVIVKHAPCAFEKGTGFFVTKIVQKTHTQSIINVLEYESHFGR